MKNYTTALIEKNNQEMLENAREMAEQMGRGPNYRPIYAMNKDAARNFYGQFSKLYKRILDDFVSKLQQPLMDGSCSYMTARMEIWSQMGVNSRNRFGNIVEVEGLDY